MAAVDSSDDWMDLTQVHLNWTELKELELYQILLRLGKRHKQKTEKEQQQG